ncbi:MAG: primosomal protein N', partial [Verrucomicrobia bacterium]|nr:primosomal protein N' [Verrucomicrobiota bacterium]
TSKIQVGCRVKVPVRSRESLATVVALLEQAGVEAPRPLTAIVSPEPVLSPALLELARWMSDYYCCVPGIALRAAIPQVIRQGELSFRRERYVEAARDVPEGDLEALRQRAPRQAAVYDLLLQAPGPVRWADARVNAATTDRTLQQLVARGLVKVSVQNASRDPYGRETYVLSHALVLNDEQRAALEVVTSSVKGRNTQPVLLHGVTGSGKTEVYLQAIQHCLELGYGALVLVPEISLTPQTVERFKMRFGPEMIAVLHSMLSAGERHDEWHKLRDRRARVAIGPRSAVFAPVPNLGLIVVDEEHENSYKQEEAPRYHARDLAVMRAHFEKCAVLLGSATPSIESYHNACTGKYRLARLCSRVDDRAMPLIRVVDLRQEFLKQKTLPIISTRLGLAIEERLQRKEQVILFLNRRGFATSLVCNACGYVCQCPNCSVALTYHLEENRIKCHLCGHAAIAPSLCPHCSDPGIRYTGYGTEKVEGTVRKLFSQAVVARMDADTMSRKDAYRETLTSFRTGKIDILIGTQMIAKGLDFPNVTLVGIINADIGLHLPDFRAGERTFQLLTQVAGRAGRGDLKGEVFVQSSTPFSPSIQFARHHDFEGFWEQEIEFRRRCDYPPFVHLVLIQVHSEHQRRAEFSAETLHRRLQEALDSSVTLHAVVPAPIERTKRSYRFQILLRSRAVLRLSRQIKTVIEKMKFPEDVHAGVDVDPYYLL